MKSEYKTIDLFDLHKRKEQKPDVKEMERYIKMFLTYLFGMIGLVFLGWVTMVMASAFFK